MAAQTAGSGPRRSSSIGGSSLGDPCSCSKYGSLDEDPLTLGLELALLNGDVKGGVNLPVLDNESSTVPDMQALDAHDSRKMKDDSKVHHILEDAMFKPRKRFHRHHQHMLPNESHNNALYHHNVHKNMHHILSHSLRTKHANDKHHGHSKKQREEDGDKPRKNVSFANAAEAEVKAVSEKKAADEAAAALNIATKAAHTTEEFAGDTPPNEFDASSDDGFTFTLSKTKDVDATDAGHLPRESYHSTHSKSKSKSKSKHASKPTLTETTLPWRSAASLEDPVSMESILVINGDDQPCPGEAPSWVDEEVCAGSPPNNGSLPTLYHSEPSFLEALTLTSGNHSDAPFSLAPQLARAGRPEPDIVNCSVSNEPLWTKKIDDFQEHVSHEGPVPDLGAVTFADLVMSSAASLDVVDGPGTPMSGPDDCYLPATWRTTDELPLSRGRCDLADGATSDSAGVGSEQQTNLPPPWKNSPDTRDEDDDYDSAQKSNVVFELGPPSESASARSLPWETTPGDVVLNMEDGDELYSDIDQSSMRCLSTDSVPDADDCLPPPWRSVNVSEASIPVRSPSASHELDSLVPQASHNSLRLSEAESRHSEQFRGHHHVIDIGPRELEQSSSGSGLSAMVGEDAEPIDLVSRVQRWLLDTKLDQQEPVPEDLYDAGADVAGAVTDLSDATDCEDTYL